MKAEKAVIKVLNQALGQALIAINQYFFTRSCVKKLGCGRAE